MKEYGPPDNPWPELPPAATLYDVHWKKGGPPEPHFRLVMGLQDPGGNSHFMAPLFWEVTESGTEEGSVLLQGTSSNNYLGVMTLSVVSYSGANMFGTAPVDLVSVAPGASYTISLTGTMSLGPPPAGLGTQTGVATYTVVTFDPYTGKINGSLLSITGSVESNQTQTFSVSTGGIAPK